MEPMLGVVGGMGPLATAQFYRRLIELSGERAESRHVPVVIVGDPRVPSRPAAIADGSVSAYRSVLAALIESVRRAEAAGATLLVMPCNTAHHWFADLRAATTLPFPSIVEATAGRLREERVRGSVAILGTRGTVAADLYGSALRGLGLTEVRLREAEQRDVDAAIDAFKLDRLDAGRERLASALGSVAAHGAEVAVLACSELAMGGAIDAPVRLVDATDCLAVAAITAMDRAGDGPAD